MPRKALNTRIIVNSPPLWIISFADMATLMLCFLILLMGYSTLNKKNEYSAMAPQESTFKEEVAKEHIDPLLFPSLTSLLPPSFIKKLSITLKNSGQNIHWRIMDQTPVLSLGSTALFEKGSITLTEAGKALLDGVIPFLSQQGRSFIIAGHTAPRQDEEGKIISWAKPEGLSPSWDLSFQRAYAVFDHFSKRGIPKEKMTIKAFGEFRPEYNNYSAEGRAANRRVEIILAGHKKFLDGTPNTLFKTTNDASLYYKGFKFDITMPGDKKDLTSTTTEILYEPLSKFLSGVHE